MVLESGEGWEVVRRQELALDNGEVHLDLVGPPGAEAGGGALAAMRGAIVDDPEYAAGGSVRLFAHDLSDQALEGDDAGLALAAAEQLGAMHVPGGDVCPSAGACVFVLDVNRSSWSRRQRGMFAPARLDA